MSSMVIAGTRPGAWSADRRVGRDAVVVELWPGASRTSGAARSAAGRGPVAAVRRPGAASGARSEGARAAGSGRLRLTRRGRVVLTLLALGLMVVAGLVFSAVAGADAPAQPQDVTVVSVAAGETLWQIASAVTVPGADVRDTIDQIVEINALEGSRLDVGQQLVVPVRAG